MINIFKGMIGLKSHIYPKMFCKIRTKPQKTICWLNEKFIFSLSQRGRVRVGVNDISGLSFPPPAPPGGRGVFVQALFNA
jgi:hypothetical protein